MLDDKTTQFLEKLAKDGSLGESKVKRKTVKETRRHEAQGTGLGAVLGTAAGAMAKRYKPLSMAVGALAGAKAGSSVGKRVKTKTKRTYDEGEVKRRETRDDPGKAVLPRLEEAKRLESK